MWILNDIRYAALGDDTAALCARLRSELYDPVCPRKNMRVMIHKDDGISVRNKIVHYAGKAVNIGGMKSDRLLGQHIQHAGGPVADRSCQRHPLPLSG